MLLHYRSSKMSLDEFFFGQIITQNTLNSAEIGTKKTFYIFKESLVLMTFKMTTKKEVVA